MGHRLEPVRMLDPGRLVHALALLDAKGVGELLIAVEELVKGAVRDLRRPFAIELLVKLDLLFEQP